MAKKTLSTLLVLLALILSLGMPANPRVSAQTPAQTSTQVPEPVCGGPAEMTILVLGIDENEQADAIRLVRLDYIDQKVSILSIPRDFYVPIADMQSHNIRYGRINATYGYGEFFNGPGRGIASILTNIEYNWGVSLDRHLVLHLDQIGHYIDQIGGVDVELAEPVSDGSSFFAAGPHHFNGETALTFIRMRYYDTDFHRIRRQSLLLTAFFKKALNELTFFQQMRLAFKLLSDEKVATNFSIFEMSSIICLARSLQQGAVQYVEIPKDMYHGATTIYGGAVQIPHHTVPAFVQSVMDGNYQP